MSVVVELDPTNPGHFFAACGLMELASRATAGATLARFEGPTFVVDTGRTLTELLCDLVAGGLRPVESEEDGDSEDEEAGSGAAAPIEIGTEPSLLLDWWQDLRHGRDLKLWAGTMNGPRIAQAMLSAIADPSLHTARIFDHATVVMDPENPSKKVEPFYFDARRAGNASSRDVGFAPNDLKLETLAFPAVEILCLIGLQRFRPAPVPGQRRVFDYCTWNEWLPILVAPAVSCGLVHIPGTTRYRFESWFRTSQRKHKAFKPARLISQGGLL